MTLSVGELKRRLLTPRWGPLRYHEAQARLMDSTARYTVVPAGRRSGKTELVGKRKMLLRCLCSHRKDLPQYFKPYADPRFMIAAPTHDQVRRIYWDDVCAMVPRHMLAKPPHNTSMTLYFLNGAELHLMGMDRSERAEGVPWDHVCLDEFANMKPEVWTAHLRPALSDRKGGADFIGVPEGRNHYYELYKYAQSVEAAANRNGEPPEWETYTWPSSEILPPLEVEAAKRDLDELTFQQEYLGSFVSFSGRAYYPFNEKLHLAPLKYDPNGTIAFCLDFNVDPGVAVVCQEQTLPNGLQGTAVIGEVWIPQNSNTVLVATRLANDWKSHAGRIIVYGDATGGARRSSGVLGSDWELFKQVMRAHFPLDRVFYKISPANPPERERVNAVNSRLKSFSGEVRVAIDPSRAPHLVVDLEGVTLVKGGSGEIDKRHSPELSHASDGWGYYIQREFPVRTQYAPAKSKFWK